MEAQQKQSEENGSTNMMTWRHSSSGSTRWTPTADQVRILKHLYYNNGVRSPTADQIQRISSRLRQYGKIEGKNVFYWFQNHKARERQKLRFSPSVASAAATSTLAHRRHCHHHAPMQNLNGQEVSFLDRSYPTNNIIVPAGYYCASSASASAVSSANGKTARSIASVSMEKRFRDCTISPTRGEHASAAGRLDRSLRGLERVDRCYNMKPFELFGVEQRNNSATGEENEEDAEGEEESPEKRRTLSLFPVNPSEAVLNHRWYRSDQRYDGYGVSHSPSLELSLNSYTGVSPRLI